MFAIVSGGFHNVPKRRWRILPEELTELTHTYYTEEGEQKETFLYWSPSNKRIKQVYKHLCGIKGCRCSGIGWTLEASDGQPLIWSNEKEE